MAIYINDGHVADDGGKPWKHLDDRCPVLLERAAAGRPIKRVRNMDDGKPLHEHRRRRCPTCFEAGGTIVTSSEPTWLREAQRLANNTTAVAWVYDLAHPTEPVTQVGMASDLYARLKSRHRATCQSRFGVDCIPWYHDLLRESPSANLRFNATPYPSRAAALAAEADLRRRKRAQGWTVSSDA